MGRILQIQYKKKNIKKVEPFNRLIAHTKNYFLIGGYGAFTEGYVLIITKDFIPSYGLIEEINNEELNFLISIVKKMNIKKYKKSSVIFEHGMCACVGGLDRAHIHIMTINEKTTEDTLLSSINQTLYSRKAGIDSIEYKNYKLQNIHDINHFFENKQDYSENEIKINGKILSLEDIKNLNQSKIDHIRKQFQSDENFVRNKVLGNFDFVKTYKGWIPERFAEVKNLKFSFVHIDVDLYEPTTQTLEFFFPRLVNGGFIVCDDYNSLDFNGARKAWDNFFSKNKVSFNFAPTLGSSFIIK